MTFSLTIALIQTLASCCIVDHALWATQRPLSPEYVQYASADVVMIASLYSKFLSLGYIDPSTKAKSARYVSFWTGRQPSKTASLYLRNPFLPLEVIDDEPTPSRTKKTCTHCTRDLTEDSFSYSQWTRPNSKARSCWVCLAMAENMYMFVGRDRAIERQGRCKSLVHKNPR